MKKFSKIFLVPCLSLALIASASFAHADYPTRTIKIITQAAPGAVIDLISRQLASMLSAELGQNVIVVNQAGAGGNLATNSMLSERADGYTLANTGLSPFGTNIFSLSVRYKFEDLAPISAVNSSEMAIIAPITKDWVTVEDAFKAAKAENRALKVAIMDTESRNLLEYIAEKEDVKLALVPQQGGSPILTAVLGGHVDLGIVGSIAVDNTRAGKIKTLASASPARFKNLPDVSTIQEQGYDVSYPSVVMLFCSAKVPAEVRTILSEAMIKISATEEFQAMLEQFDVSPITTGEEYALQIVKDSYQRAKMFSEVAD